MKDDILEKVKVCFQNQKTRTIRIIKNISKTAKLTEVRKSINEKEMKKVSQDYIFFVKDKPIEVESEENYTLEYILDEKESKIYILESEIQNSKEPKDNDKNISQNKKKTESKENLEKTNNNSTQKIGESDISDENRIKKENKINEEILEKSKEKLDEEKKLFEEKGSNNEEQKKQIENDIGKDEDKKAFEVNKIKSQNEKKEKKIENEEKKPSMKILKNKSYLQIEVNEEFEKKVEKNDKIGENNDNQSEEKERKNKNKENQNIQELKNQIEFTQNEKDKIKNKSINKANIQNNLNVNNQRKQNKNNSKSLNTSNGANNNNKTQKLIIESHILEESKEKEINSSILLEEKKISKEKIQNLICFVIINNEYSNKIRVFFKSERKLVDSIIYENINQFEDIKVPHYTFFNKCIKRNLIIYEVELPISIKIIQIIFECDNNEYKINTIYTLDQETLISFIILPLKNDDLLKKHIIFDCNDEKEKYLLFYSLLNFFKDKNASYKRKFCKKLFENFYFYQFNDIKDIFTISHTLNDNFLDDNFAFIINQFRDKEIKEFTISEEIKNQINNLYQSVINFKNKEEISEEIWSFLILSLIKIEQNEKINVILSKFENLKEKNEISKVLFKDIKKLIRVIPEIKNYFALLLKYNPSELHFIIDNINDYAEYIDIIEKNFNYLRNIRIIIFPEKFNYQNNHDSEKILHKIINLLKECKDNSTLDTLIFKQIFKNYLEILNFEEKNILINYLKSNFPRDSIINEIRMNGIEFCKNNEEIINVLAECKARFEDLVKGLKLINLAKLSLELSKKLAQIKKSICRTNKEVEILYLLLFKRIKSLEDLRKLWNIFGYFIFEQEVEIYNHIEKFWDFYNSDKDNYNNYNYFFHMFFFLKENKKHNFESQFLIKITEIENLQLVIKILNSIVQYQKDLSTEDNNIIFNYFIKFSSEQLKFIKSIKLSFIPSFLFQNIKYKNIEMDDFFKETSEINGIFKIFNFLNGYDYNNFKNSHFFKNSITIYQNFKESVKENEISYIQLEKLNNLLEKPTFNERLIYFKFTEREKNDFVQKIKNKYQDIVSKKNKLEECKKYLNEFQSSEGTKKKKLINSKLRDSDKSIKKFEKSLEEKGFINRLDKLYERAQKYNKMIILKTSLIFMNELENRVDKEDGKIKFLEAKINDIRKILSIKTINEINNKLLLDFLSIFENENELLNEISNLKNYFKVSDDTSLIEKYLSFHLKKYKIHNTILGFLDLIKIFKLEQTDFYNKLDELKNKIIDLEKVENENETEASETFKEETLEQNISKIDQMIIDFEDSDKDLNLKILPFDIISFIINKFQENNLLEFLFELTINDLRDITNSLAGSSLDINDINDYQLIKSIINELKEKNGLREENDEEKQEENDKEDNNKINQRLKDVAFIKIIIPLITQKLNGKTIEEFKDILKKCSKNQPKLLVLFENKKGFESSKEDIRNIISKSIFEIYYDKDISNSFELRYNCRCLFKERTSQKNFKELIVLEQLASLSQNKEKKDENKILNIFIDLMENIKDILSMIDKITYKGFPQEFYYLIKINNGEADCKNMNVQSNKKKTISEEKSFLKRLLEKINLFQIDAYKNNKYIKFFYGQQLTMFNNYLKGKIGKSFNNNEVSNLIYYIIGNKFQKVPNNFLYQSSLSISNFGNENNDILNEDLDNDKKDELNIHAQLTNRTQIDLFGISTSQENIELNKKQTTFRKNQFKKAIPVPIMKQGNENELELIMKDMYKNVENYLTKIMLCNNIEIEEIFKSSRIDEKYNSQKYKGLFITNSENIYKQILKFYYGLVGNEPPRYSLLLCNEETTLEEVISFIYLAVFCPYHSLFIIAKPDRLNIDIIYEMENIIEKFHEENIVINSYILFLFNDIGKSEIGEELLKICSSADEPKEDLRIINLKDEISTDTKIENKDYFKYIEVVSSSRAGLGKTFYIKKRCKEENIIYVPFPIGGEVKRHTIMRRLKDLNLDKKKKYGLHLDFSDTKQKEIFEDFIFTFLIQKVYANNENIFCYENNVKIFIEIPNGFFNFMEKFKLFNEFSNYKINELPKLYLFENKSSFKDFEDMADDEKKGLTSFLDIQKKNEALNHNYLYKSDIQIVCNYLKFFNEMSCKNLFFYNLNEKLKEIIEFNYYCNSEFIDEEECNELLNKFFNKSNRSYHQINIYIKVLADQLRKFSINFYLMIENLNDGELPGTIRTDIIKAFMDLTSYFTIGAFDKILSEQDSSINNRSISTVFNENKESENATNKLSEEESVINFNELNDKALIFINDDGQSFTIITCTPKTSPLYKKLDSLFNSGAKFEDEKNKHLTIPDFTKMVKNEEFLEIIKKIVDIKEDVQTIVKKLGTYVFNADNFFKMVQILIRFRTGIPVLIMGETGCGKTSLINAIVEINNYKMLTFNIHAGVNDNEIVQFMAKNNLLEKKIGYDKYDDDIENLYNFDNDEDSNSLSVSNLSMDVQKNKNKINEKEKNDDKLIIVFFDEFNTCNSLGLLTEIMCTKKCQGIDVKKNVVFVGACNPYRKITNKRNNSTALIKEGSANSEQKLIYIVNPLTYTQLYYIINFGSLSAENEKKYITGIVEAEIGEYVKDKEYLNDIKKMMIDTFTTAQAFIKEKNGKESVSMRETRKFMTIYKFLIKDFVKKKDLSFQFYNNTELRKSIFVDDDIKFYLDKDEFLAQKYCIATAIYICFYIRLSDIKDKTDFQFKMNKILNLDFLSYPKQLQDELIKNIKLEKGIAPNEALRLNLFICFIGILTRISVFLVGPPGCSKTLCFNLLKNEMKGYHSKSKFWQQYPQLFVTSYQGSLTSTSKGIIDAFKDAEKKLKDYISKEQKNKANDKKIDEQSKKDKGIIVCVFIDEIGLCEISPYNPLKALHTYLELDYKNQNKEEKLAFVGISNWKLDAAKMNRGIYLNVINPISDYTQMKDTALQITNVYDKTFSVNYSELIEKLAKAVFNYNIYLKQISAEQIHFHGARDFYNLIKTVTKKILEKNPKEDAISSSFLAIESNYNGIFRNGVNSADLIKKEFKKIYPEANNIEQEEFGIIKCIKNNINDEDSRYLLLIMKSNLSQYLILKILKTEMEEKKIFYYLGSLFEDDIYNEAYCAKTINKIKYYLEHDIILILKNLSTTYASLYDLLNQRFTYIKNQKYAEISLGEVSNSTFVNDNLKIIVFIREDAVKEQDPPFLNRFEKYYISFDNLLDSQSKEFANKILENRKLFKKPKKSIKFNFENELINFYDEEIKSLVLDYKFQLDDNSESNNFKEENIFNNILEKISKTLPQDLIAFLNHYRKKNKNFVNKINYYYSKAIHSNLKTFINKTSHSINVIYTFTSTVRSNKFKFEVDNELFGVINTKNLKNIYINLVRTERQLEIDISDFYDSESKLLLVHFEEKDAQNLEFIIMFLKRFEKEKELNNLKKKIIIIIIHLTRKKEEYNKDIFVPTLSGFEQTFIDNLYGKDFLITEIMEQNIIDLYNKSNLVNVDELFKSELYPCFQKIDYSFQDKAIEQKDHIERIINKILEDNEISEKIKKRIINEIERIHNEQEDNEIKNNLKEKNNIFDNIFENNSFETTNDFISILSSELEQKFTKYLTKFIVNGEKQSILSSLIKDLPKNIKVLWDTLFDKFIFTNEVSNNLKSNKIKIWTKLSLPSINSINQIKKVVESDANGYIKKYQDQEIAIRDCNEPGDIVESDDENEEEVEEKKNLVNEFFCEENNIEDPKFENAKEEINKYFVPKIQVINYLKNHIEKDILIKSFNKEKNKEELIDLFFKDYFSQFITSIVQSEDTIYYEVLRYLIELRFGNKNEDENSLIFYSKSILWTQIYKDEFVFLFKNFAILKEIFSDINFLDKVKEKIDSQEIKYIISSHHPRHKQLIDKPFLLILDSLFYNLIEQIEKLNSVQVLQIINNLLEIVQNGEIYNSNLSLKSKDLYRFKTLFISIKLFNDKNVYDKEKINKYIGHIKNERKMLLENNLEQVSVQIKSQIELLLNHLPDCEEKTKTIMKILISKYKEVTDIGCREILCDFVLKDDKLIKISNEFFIHILDSFSFTPDSLESQDDSHNPFSKASESNKLLKKINGKEISKILKENLKYIFKFKILQYYNGELNKSFDNDEERIREEINIYLGESSLNYFKNAHNTLIEINNAKDAEIPNKNIKEIFCLVYCCVFLENFVKYVIKQVAYVSTSRNKIIQYLNEGTSEIKETFKLFILKELKTKYITERTQFLNIDKWIEDYKLRDLFSDLKFEKSKNSKEIQGSLTNLFYGNYGLEEFLDEQELRNSIAKKYHELNEISFLINIDLFINEYLSTLKTEEGIKLCQNSTLMKCFNLYIKKNDKFSKSTKKLINLFFDQQIYIDKLSTTIKKTNYFEIILYAYRFAIICSLADKNSIYSNMIKEKCYEEINNSYIPGADLYCDLWVESYLNMIDPITKNDGNAYSSGFYICDCGEYYYQQPCGVPTDISYCANCHKKIGGLKEKLVIRDEDNGQYKITRIYSSKENKENVEARGDLISIYGENFENGYPNKIFSEFEKEMQEKMNNDYKGILEQNYLLFIKETKKIRNLSQISYRILNFIIYSNIFFAYKCGFLTLEEINNNNFIPIKEEAYKGDYSDEDSYNDYRAKLLNRRKKESKDENNILEILNINWMLIEKLLKEKNINVNIFINSIINDLFDKIAFSGDMKTAEQRNKFESEIKDLIDNAIDKYKENSEIYHTFIEKSTIENLEPNYIILEKNSIIPNAEAQFPYYYEFLSIPVVNENQLEEILKSIDNSKIKYPVLCAYLDSNKKDIEYLQAFSQINNFVNYTIEHYTNQISREKANSKKINEELIAKNIPIDLFEDFLKGFNDSGLYNIADRYECHNLKEILKPRRKLTKQDNLSDFLIDNGVQGYGMLIAAIYQKFISFQNSFLDKIIYNISSDNKKLKYIKEKISENINPQKANKYNVISFDITTENDESFLEMILFYSYKDSFDENFNFDFSKKDRIEYNLEEIEEQLEHLLLPGKKKFNDKLEFVVYQFEGFRSQNSSILSTFISNYPQKKLDEEQKQILYNFRSEQYSTESIIKILFSIQLMITFYNEQLSSCDKNIKISETFSDFPPYFKIPDDTKNLFRISPFTISHIISVYEYFELLCFNEFKNNIDPQYKQIISEEKKENIENYFKSKPDALLTKLEISTAVRRFISRSLVGVREDSEVAENQELFDFLRYKEDCWNREISSSARFDEEIENLRRLDIKVGEVLNLYEKLGGDSSLLGEAVKKQVQEAEEEEENNKQAKNQKPKKKKGKKIVF